MLTDFQKGQSDVRRFATQDTEMKLLQRYIQKSANIGKAEREYASFKKVKKNDSNMQNIFVNYPACGKVAIFQMASEILPEAAEEWERELSNVNKVNRNVVNKLY